MGLTKFPNGLSSFGVPVLGGGNIITTGNIFFVDSVTGSNGNSGADKDHPFATIDYAVGKCTANKGDHIIVMPKHVETVTAAAGLDLDVAGITVYGLGSGANRPQVNFTTATAADMDVDAVDITVYNILFTGGVDALVAPIDVNAADFKLIGCEWRDVTGQATDVILTDANASRMLIKDWRHDGDTAAGTNAGIAIVGGDGIVIDGLRMDGNFAVGGIDIRTTATTDLEVRNGYFRTRNAADIFLIDTITGSTGIIGPNIYLRLQDNAANITEAVTGATFVLHQKISVVNAANEVGMEINWTASTDAIV
ncbi:hypothetical protein EPN95_04535 [Patescibacteria group bacterium]|nr:MAG: hypothetical protein EPN95_04535 [Patescibacteria group bacterium]